MPNRPKKAPPGPRAARPRRKRSVHAPRAAAPRAATYVVGVGASAGGLEALEAFFGAMPSGQGLAFVVVVHLPPAHASRLSELLGRVARLEVVEARDRQRVDADHVYVIPPNRALTLRQGVLWVEEVTHRRTLRGVIDLFFRSLAEDRGDHALGIVLSGAGTEGTLGIRAVKAKGGLVMAQAPDTAAQPGMPASAIATGLVDVVAAPSELPAALLAYVEGAIATRATPARDEPLDELATILDVVRARTGLEFRGYKASTLRRRIERRLGLAKLAGVAEYVELLRSEPGEVEQLARDLRIAVTAFFRDPLAFDELSSAVLAKLVEGNRDDAPLRIWVPGCSTGEEAYSLAIALAERMTVADVLRRVQIFATDVDAEALATARAGTYPESIALDVSPQRLARFFTYGDHRYTITKPIRDSVVFALHDLVVDAPFSKLDLVSCRNVFIYLETAVQDHLLRLFHFALKPGGYLFLGGGEGVGALEDHLYAPISERHHVFQRVGPVTRPSRALVSPWLASSGAARLGERTAAPSVAELADRQLLAHVAPSAVVVRSTGHIVRLYGAMDRYVQLPSGDATLDLPALARDGIKSALRAALHESVQKNRPVAKVVELRRDRRPATLRITLTPIKVPAAEERLWLAVFEETPSSTAAANAAKLGREESARVQLLQSELEGTRREQQRLVEQLETSNEELLAANEEVLSMNEELQSTNAQLLRAKAVLEQQVVERTRSLDQAVRAGEQVAAALSNARQEQEDTAATLDSFLAATNEGVLCHGERGIITYANAALHAMFGYAPGELVGLPIDQLLPEAERSHHAVERDRFWSHKRARKMGEGRDLRGLRKDGTSFPIEVSLTYVATGAPDRLVFAFVSDITARKRAEDELRRSHEELKEKADQLRRLASDITLEEQRVREQLAKTVHDSIQQLLFGVKLRIDRLATGQAGRAPDVAAELDTARTDLDQAIAAARSLSVELFPPTLNNDGLGPALSWLANWMQRKYGLRVDVTLDPRAVLEQQDRRTLVFESVRELLFNVVKHAGVARATADLARADDGGIRVTIADEGTGFDPAAAIGRRAPGWGLFAIRERLTLLGGALRIDSAPGRGARFSITLPREAPPPDGG